MIELLYLVDGSVPVQKIDVHGIKWLLDAGTYLSIVFTKTDKEPLRGCHPDGPVEAMCKALWDMEGSPWRLGVKREMPTMLLTSSAMKTGREALLEHIADLRRRARPRYLETMAAMPVKLPKGAVPQVNSGGQALAPPPGIR